MEKKFYHNHKDFHLIIKVKGNGDPETNRKGFVPLLKGEYMGSRILNPAILERDFHV